MAEKRQTIYHLTNKMIDVDPGQVEMHPWITEPTKRIEVNPLDAQALYQRAVSYSNFNQTDQAIEDYTSAIKINPQFKEAYLERAFDTSPSTNRKKRRRISNALMSSASC